MPSLLDIKRRVKSVKNIRQITKAMEKISAIKMKKSQSAAYRSRRYARIAWEMFEGLQGHTEENIHPLLEKKEVVKSIGILVISTDKGLCGSMNTRLTNSVIASIAEQGFSKNEVKLYTIGKKCRELLSRLGYLIVADFGTVPAQPDPAFSLAVIKTIVEDYTQGKIDKVFIAHTDFINTLSQKPSVKQILPIDNKKSETEAKTQPLKAQYIFEPSPEEVLINLITRILELQVYQGSLESNASEHSARMVAMKSATDNASDLISELTLIYNQARQTNITREMAEISAGRIALE